jgi:hypothetical protein
MSRGNMELHRRNIYDRNQMQSLAAPTALIRVAYGRENRLRLQKMHSFHLVPQLARLVRLVKVRGDHVGREACVNFH